MATGLKKKYTQNDLRRLMSEQKAKSAPAKANTAKIQSPLAKYTDLGQLMCVLCKTIVRSEDVWKVHINAKQHKQNVELAKKTIGTPAAATSAATATVSKSAPTASASVSSAMKRPMAPPPVPEIPAKMPKSILKSNNNQAASGAQQTNADTNALPDNFFDAPSIRSNSGDKGSFYETTLTKTSIKMNLVNIKRSNSEADNVEEMGGDATDLQQQQLAKDETLPEGFFDDPIKDAKARNLEYKDPVEEEWEKFQQEIKAASDFSNAIIAEDQEEAITERQIDEIDEQIRNWNRLVEHCILSQPCLIYIT